ncbi:MAG TPA: hypothetical protein IGS53_17340 [Leptolyngbyaceae cyanobacterium M33_DOE_097]|uniref:Uncharacterized protein n=1 Tax=Oscillatoriales cyanobacterium SpSt-418 TaxID=2282169 RepID=A0A7C3KFD2_9CYAN|nr:hypothetical protein [Leptolyngbyaceae cyanobacterium M33_DOE_097]
MKIKNLLGRKSFYPLLGFITLLVLFLGSSRQIQAFTGAGHDDRLFVNHAISLVQGNWLGSYSQFTLIKGPFYPFFLAINYVLGLPLLLSQQAFYCLSGLALIYALSYFCRDRLVLLLIYTLYVFHPIPFGINRVIREGIYASLTTFVIAGSILMMANLMGKVPQAKVAVTHACLFGISLGCFWLTREEGIWLLPSIGLLISLGLVNQFRQSRDLKVLIKQSRPLILGLLITVMCVVGVAFTNYTHYGVFLARSELVSTEFKAAYGALTRVKSKSWDAYIPVPREVRQQLYSKSGKFRSLQAYLEDPETVKVWSQAGCQFYLSACNDYAGGWFVWVLRDAVASAGYADTAPQALKFYRELATEINGLCDSKQLECLPRRTGTMPPLRVTTLQALPHGIKQGIKMSLRLPNLNLQGQQTSMGDLEGLMLFTKWTRVPASPTISSIECHFNRLEILGWFNRVDGKLQLVGLPKRIVNNGEFFWKTTLPSPDLVKAFNNPKLYRSRFKLDVCCKTCKLALTDKKDKLLKEVDLLQGATHGNGPWGAYHLDSVQKIVPGSNESKLPEPAVIKSGILNWVNVFVYQHLVYYANIFALGIWCLRFILMILRFLPWSIIYGIATSLLVAILIRVTILSLIEATSFPAVNFYYLLPSATLVPIFTLLMLSDFVLLCRRRWSLNS